MDLANLKCPKCGAPVEEEDLFPASVLARCGCCSAVFIVEALRAGGPPGDRAAGVHAPREDG